MKNRIPNEGRKIKSASIFSRYNVYMYLMSGETGGARDRCAPLARCRGLALGRALPAACAANEPTQIQFNWITFDPRSYNELDI